MKKLTLVASFALAALFASNAMAGEDISQAAQTASDVCSKCHGDKGDSTSPLFPRLAGQQAAYLEQELKLFRDKGRGDPHARAYMWGIAGPLTDDQIKGLATYFSQQRPVKGTPASDPALAAKGKALFQHGDDARGIPVCASCHGERAEGNDAIPRLAGQWEDYLVNQMEAFRGTLRVNETMHANTEHLTNDDIQALAAYLSSL